MREETKNLETAYEIVIMKNSIQQEIKALVTNNQYEDIHRKPIRLTSLSRMTTLKNPNIDRLKIHTTTRRKPKCK